jgi:predicted NodU family carbamoyl transferase
MPPRGSQEQRIEQMSQLILTAHTGIHDAGAALFEDYNLLAAVQLERLTRFKCDGRDHPDLAIDEVLSIAGKTRRDVDVAGFSRCEFPTIFYRNIAAHTGYGKNIAEGVSAVSHQKYRRHLQGRQVPARQRLSRRCQNSFLQPS